MNERNDQNDEANTNVNKQTLYVKLWVYIVDFPETLYPYVDVCCAASTTTCPAYDTLSTGGDVHQILQNIPHDTF